MDKLYVFMYHPTWSDIPTAGKKQKISNLAHFYFFYIGPSQLDPFYINILHPSFQFLVMVKWAKLIWPGLEILIWCNNGPSDLTHFTIDY